MIRTIFTFLLIVASLACAQAQDAPQWVSASYRKTAYPQSLYIVGYAEGNILPKETRAEAVSRIKREAQKALSESLRIQLQTSTSSYSQNVAQGSSEQMSALFESAIKASSSTELVGVKSDAYYNATEKIVHGFAYANRMELKAYYKINIANSLDKIDNYLLTAAQLEGNGMKPQARKQCQEAVPLLGRVVYMQGLLTAMYSQVDDEDLQHARMLQLHSKLAQAWASMEQNVYICVESTEDLLGKQSNLASNKLKGQLAKMGCSFTDDPSVADYKLTMNVSARKLYNSTPSSIVFCYADAEVDLLNTRTGKSLYHGELSKKGGSTTPEHASREAFEEVALAVADKLKPWLLE